MKVTRIQAGTDAWDRTIESLPHHNVYQRSTYHELASQTTGGSPLLLVFEKDQSKVAIPIMIRPIDLSGMQADGVRAELFNKPLQDVTSVYGYPGILTSSEQFSPQFGKAFREVLHQEMLDLGIVSLFLRLGVQHPDLLLLKGLGELEKLGPSVMVDLELDDQQRRQLYRRNHRIDILSLRKKKAATTDDPQFRRLNEFESAYHETMKRVRAVSWFDFGIEHFERLCQDLGSEIFLLNTTVEGHYSCGGLFFGSDETVYAHLVGTGNDWVAHSPTKLLFDDAASYFRNQGRKWLVLGGGVGCRRDNLFRFKSGFSETVRPFRVWKWVINRRAYQALCRAKSNGHNAGAGTEFFPTYRSSELS